MIKLLHGNCLGKLKYLEDNSIDSIVTDPPYGLSFMGKHWDYDVPTENIWRECLRVLKPGGHLLSFFGTRTYHRGVVRIEDAGFEIRDQIMWIYGSGFPKSHNVSKSIDSSFGAERVMRVNEKWSEKYPNGPGGNLSGDNRSATFSQAKRITNKLLTSDPVTDLAKQWDGWGSALKPANEPIVVARKPLEKGLTIAENVIKWGTGAINIDGSRIAPQEKDDYGRSAANSKGTINAHDGFEGKSFKISERNAEYANIQGRWPANILFDEDAAQMLDEQSGFLHGAGNKKDKPANPSSSMFGISGDKNPKIPGDVGGGASRFFYVAKASKSERNAGLDGMPLKESGIKNDSGRCFSESDPHKKIYNQNHHPTVKPIKLMEYLCKLVTPPNGVVLDPFMGSGSTGVAAIGLGFSFVGCEMSDEYLEIAKKRIDNASKP